MQKLYDDTSLTPISVARLSGYIDWASQPSLFKHYPNFLFRYAYGTIPELKIAELSRYISAKTTLAGEPYYRLNTPSAGNLHPIELYVQIRGIKSIISGIYHVDAREECLVLIREIERDGIEPMVGLSECFAGMLFIISIVPFRSEWKYANRALRYCYLDAGHQAGAILASAHVLGQKATILSHINALSLNTSMGFDKHEFVSMVIGVGVKTHKSVEALTSPLIHVSPTDYCEYTNIFLQHTEHYKYTVAYPFIDLFIAHQSTIYQRRSVRHFADKMLSRATYDYFLKRIFQVPLPVIAQCVVLKNASKVPGIYRDRGIQKQGEYSEAISHLLIDQFFVKNAAIVIIFTTQAFTTQSLICAAMFAHVLYLEAEERGVGFTGIGAFYDKKLQDFLEIRNPILYVCALGEAKV